MRLYVFLFIVGFSFFLAGCFVGNEGTNHDSIGGNYPLAIQLNLDENEQHFDLVGVPKPILASLEAQPLSQAEWQTFYAVFVEGMAQSMLGTYSIKSEMVRFTPAFPLMAGQTYEATYSPESLVQLLPASSAFVSRRQTVIEAFTIPQAETSPTTVTKVYPTADQLPANLLRFYIYFSAPMREGEALEHIALIDAKGKEVPNVFFDPIFELWDPSMQRLTLLFDPGRVKTGLRAHKAFGRALVPGETYTLRIKDSIIDANGNRLDDSFEKSFRVIGPDLSPPDVNTWVIIPPVSGGQTPLIVQFPALLDHQLLYEFVQVRTVVDERVVGKITLGQQETEWQFVPDLPWESGHYDLWVKTKLEDIAGNNIHGLFDIPPEERLLFPDQTEIKVSFQID